MRLDIPPGSESKPIEQRKSQSRLKGCVLLGYLVTNKITDFHVPLLLSQYHHDEDNSKIHRVAKKDEEFQEICFLINNILTAK